MGASVTVSETFKPAPTSLVSGSTQATATGSTILTVPAGRTWYGNIGLTLAQGAAATTNGSIQTAGTGVVPAAGTILCAAVDIGLTTAGSSSSMYADDQYIVAPPGNAVTLVTNWAVAPTAVSAFASGYLL